MRFKPINANEFIAVPNSVPRPAGHLIPDDADTQPTRNPRQVRERHPRGDGSLQSVFKNASTPTSPAVKASLKGAHLNDVNPSIGMGITPALR